VAPRITVADGRVDAVRGTIAVERGPVVLCAESVDLPAGVAVDDVRVLAGATAEDLPGAGAGAGADGGTTGGVRPVAVLRGRVVRHPEDRWPYAADAGAGVGPEVAIPLVPYHSWAERGPATMRVWLPVG
jgi:DUF1680 family protein